MPKAGELNYVRNMGEAGIAHAVNKPFSDAGCGNSPLRNTMKSRRLSLIFRICWQRCW